jgi:hypothetical protein
VRPRLAEDQPGEPAHAGEAHHGARRHELAQRDRAGQRADEHVRVLLATGERPESALSAGVGGLIAASRAVKSYIGRAARSLAR